MRKKIVAANWKMHLTLNEGKHLVNALLEGLGHLRDGHEVVLATPYIHLSQTAAQIHGKPNLYLGAQNCHTEPSGAYTGEISAAMLASAGVSYVIIGHSERREYNHETNAMLAKKVSIALANNLKVIYCCGEPLQVRDADTQNAWVEQQIREGLFHLSPEQMAHVVIAYEPIWAIGTGRTASSAQAQDMHVHIRHVLAGQYQQAIANETSILYGGSCKPSNADELFACPDVDGGLIGGAALKADEFLYLIGAIQKS
jgi:triosephosphate isomerase